MPTKKTPRKGSLQYWPRKRANKFLPRVNWNVLPSNSKNEGLKGFIGYKAGMISVYVKDNTPNSMTKNKKIAFSGTIIECPPLKILSIRFYKKSIVIKDILVGSLDKEIKRKIKIPKNKIDELKELDENKLKSLDFDDVRVLCYSVVKKTGIKKTPDICEIGLSGSIEDKIKFIRNNLKKEISIVDVFEKGNLVDFRGLTKGKGLVGPVKRFGITLKQHKSEKGRRRPGSLGPWHPARVTFRAPMAGQLGMFTRCLYNNKIIDIGKLDENSEIGKKLKEIPHYGKIRNDFIIVHGSVQGPSKRQLIITTPLRETKKQKKKDYEFIELR